MIELKDISAGYGRDIFLRGINLNIPQGRLISVIGPNGSGKSTLLKTAAGLLCAAEGEVVLQGRSLIGLSRSEIARHIAYLAQGKSVPDMTVGQLVLHGRFPHLRYPRKYSPKDRSIASDALCRMGMETLADRPMFSLSGGMRQNAYIAMVLAQDTDYILLDEPTTYLDISRQLELMKTLRALADSGKGVAAVMHDLPLAFSFSDEIAVINDGALLAAGTPEALCQSGVIQSVFGIELKYSAEENCYHYKYSSALSRRSAVIEPD